MGTRADYYIGRGKKAKYLGSIAWDGYASHESALDGKPDVIMQSENEGQFQARVEEMISKRKDGTLAKDGFPWPWEDSTTTDYAYCFDKRQVFVYIFGCLNNKGQKRIFPNMSKNQNVQFGGTKSGLITITTKGAY